jgi:hypothetical protein
VGRVSQSVSYQGFQSLRAGTPHRALALSHFLLAVISCLVIYAFPVAGLWPILLSTIPFGVRLFIDRPLFHAGLVDGLLAVFLVTALIGYWAAYDQTAAWVKLSLLVAGILLYYAISTQPESNVGALAGFWFIFGVGVSLYFLLTLDFGVSPAKFHFINQIGLKWMSIRPVVSWPAIQPTDTAAGIAIITSVYGLYFLVPDDDRSRNWFVSFLVFIGFGIVLSAVMLATSRGALVALSAAIGVWLAWMAIGRIRSRKEDFYRFFPAGVLLFIGLTALLLILPLGIFGPGFFIGDNLIINRSELIRNGISIMREFPFLGGGLTSFPGLFSQYILVIPYYSLLNSHNLFVDAGIEQGMIGGLAFLLLYSISLWKITSSLRHGHTNRMLVFYGSVFTSLFIAMVHGLVDDYLYSGWWAAMAFFPVGMSMLAAGIQSTHEPQMVSSVLFGSPSEKNQGWMTKIHSRGFGLLMIGIGIAVIGFNWNRLAAQWFANMGDVKMAQVELAGYPANKWDEGGPNGRLQYAKMLFERSLRYDSDNRLANYHLGLIEMSERDFYSAAQYLEKAYRQEPSHRGVIKNLGYSYAWLGKMDKARSYLKTIPEAEAELEVYKWWWDTQGRSDLSVNASKLVASMKNTVRQP